MYQLIYISKSVLYFSKQDLDKLAAKSIRRNQNLGITGMLMYVDGEFIQLLEGDKSAVKKLMYQKICKDKRHYALNIIKEGMTMQREFTSWDMASQLMTRSHLKYFLPNENITDAASLAFLFTHSNEKDLIKNLFINVRDNLLVPHSYLQ